jgi:hypothetical protein
MIGLLFASFTLPLNAQTTLESRAPRPFAYDKTQEVTFTGVVRQVISQPVPHGPMGLHVLVANPQGTVDVHLGPYLADDVCKALYGGEPIQIVGVPDTIHGKTYLLARQLIFGGRLVTIRSEHGFLVLTHSGATRASKINKNGDAQ